MLVKKFRCYEIVNDTIIEVNAPSKHSLSGDSIYESFDNITEAEKALENFIKKHPSVSYKIFTILPIYDNLKRD